MAEMAVFLFVVSVIRGAHTVDENQPGSMVCGYEPGATVWEAICTTRFRAIVPHYRFAAKPLGSRFGNTFNSWAVIHGFNGLLASVCANGVSM